MIIQAKKITCGIIIAFLLVAIPLVIGANDPGHDILYIEQNGNSELNGTFNVTYNTSLKGGRASLISYLDIFYNGQTPGSAPSIPTITGTASNLYVDSPGGGILYLNRYAATGVVAIGDYASQSINLNVSGSLYVKSATATIGGTAICLANGTNCPTSLGGANVTGTGTQNTIAKFTGTSAIGNSIITDNGANVSIDSGVLFVDGTNNRVGIGTTSPNTTLHVAGRINVTSTGDICIDGGKCLSTTGTGTGDVTDVLAGQGITITSTGGPQPTVNHTDTSSVSDSSNSGNIFIQDITFDTFGHVATIGTGTVAEADPIFAAAYTIINTSISARALNTTTYTITQIDASQTAQNNTYNTLIGAKMLNTSFDTSQTIQNNTIAGKAMPGTASCAAGTVLQNITTTTSGTIPNCTTVQTGTETGNCSAEGSCNLITYDTELNNATIIRTITNFANSSSSDISVSGTYNSLNLQIGNSGVTAGTYGGTSTFVIPRITISTGGRITSASNQTISEADPIFAAAYTIINTSISARALNTTTYTITQIDASQTAQNNTYNTLIGAKMLNTSFDTSQTIQNNTIAGKAMPGTASCAAGTVLQNITTTTSGTIPNCTTVQTGTETGNCSAEGSCNLITYDTELNNATIIRTITNFANSSSSDISVSGTYNSLNLQIGNSGVTAGTYGGTSTFVIPRITISTGGRITSASNQTISEADPIFAAAYTIINTSISARALNTTTYTITQIDASQTAQNNTYNTLIGAKMLNTSFDTSQTIQNNTIAGKAMPGTASCAAGTVLQNITTTTSGTIPNCTTVQTGTETGNCSAEGSCSLITYDSETTNWDKTSSDDITTSSTWTGGDLGGTGLAATVTDDSHNHVYSNIDATTSANWAGRVSDETGTGSWVFNTSPTITSPTILTGITLPDDSVAEADISFATSCDSASKLYISGGNLACNADATGADGNNYTSSVSVTGTTTKSINVGIIGRTSINATFTDIDTNTGNCSVTDSCANILYETELDSISELNTQIADADLLITGGTLTSSNVCVYDGTGIDCNLVQDGSGDCAAGSVCMGGHTHASSGGGNVSAVAGSTGYIPQFSNSANITTSVIYQTSSTIGIGTTGPDAELDVLSTSGAQLRLTYTDGTQYANFTTNSTGDLTIRASGGDVVIQLG